MNILEQNLPITYLKPGELKIAREPSLVITVLGSCVAVVFHHKVYKVGAMCHGVLPIMKPNHDFKDRFKYVDQSIYYMLKTFEKAGIKRHELDVKVFGGSERLFAASKNGSGISVGRSNVKMAFDIIEQEKLKLIAFDVGGNKGRKLYFYSDTGEIFLKKLR